MKYYLDTEFLEGPQKKTFLGFNVGQTKPTIDLISIGIVCEDGREYYAISKDFNLREAWNRFDIKKTAGGNKYRDYWIRENVLLPIYKECVSGDARNHIDFSYDGMKYVINHYGKTNKMIREDVFRFLNPSSGEKSLNYGSWNNHLNKYRVLAAENIGFEIYGYYADYDWVAFCWLFGRMIDLPKGFPMYCRDLKQEMDEKERVLGYLKDGKGNSYPFKKHADYPKQKNEHNALDDARWNRKLHEFLETL